MEKKHKKKIVITAIVLILALLIGFISVNASQTSEIKKQVESGNKYLSEGRYEQAILAFEKVLEIDEKNVEARVGLSKAYVAVKKPKNAEDVLKTGIKLTPKKNVFYLELSNLYLDQNKVEEAIEILDQGYSKTKGDDIKQKLEEISGQLQITVAVNPLQVKNKTQVVLDRKDKAGNLTPVTAKWSTAGKTVGDIQAAENKKALFLAKAQGKEDIVAKVGSIEKKASIEVKDLIVTSVEIISLTNKATVGDSVEFKAIVKDQLGNEVNVEPTWEMTGDIANMAANKGLVNKFDFIKDGTGEITASVGNVKSTAGVSVEKRKFTIVTVVSGQGTVSRTPDLQVYEDGSVVKLKAEPKTGWLFKGWQGDIKSSKNPIEITMDSNKNFKAVFEAKQYKLNTEVSGNGFITRSKNAETYAHGTKVTLTAVAKEGWKFDHWEGSSNSKTNEITVNMDGNKAFKAVFVLIHYDIVTSVSGEGRVDKEESSTNTYKLTAVAAEGWEFKEWQGDITGNTNPVVTTVNSNKNVSAVFERKQYSVNITSQGMGSVEKAVQAGDKVKLTAIAAEGWKFDHWEGDLTGSENPSIIEVKSNKNIKAVFVEKKYTLRTNVIGNGNVVITGQKELYSHGDVVELRAEPAAGWLFKGWKGSVSSTENPLIVTMDGDKVIDCEFIFKSVDGTVKNGQNASIIPGASIKVRAGRDTRQGDVIATATSDDNGKFNLYSLSAGAYTIEVAKQGFVTGYENVEVRNNETSLVTISIMPEISGDSYRVKLTWAQTPDDLDLHAYLPGGGHVYYGSKTSSDGNVTLDVDQQNGNGPENITIQRQVAGIYEFKVYNYSHEVAITQSLAKVEVFKGNTLVRTFNVPTTGTGGWWNVFKLEGDTITETNTISN